MVLLKLARMGHPVLRTRAQPVPQGELGGDALRALVESMVETMRDELGVGLAAPQVHASQRVVCVEATEPNPNFPDRPVIPLMVLANPQIVHASEEQEDGWEGCLSIPDIRGQVPRAAAIRVEALTPDGEPLCLDAAGFLARVLQHEIDHLDGVLFLDRMTDLSTLSFVAEWRRYWQAGL